MKALDGNPTLFSRGGGERESNDNRPTNVKTENFKWT